MRVLFLAILMQVLGTINAHAEYEVSGNSRFAEFYTVQEIGAKPSGELSSLNPLDVAEDIWNDLDTHYQLQARVYSLIEFIHHNEVYGDVSEPYKRDKHFGTWIRDPHDNSCYNTRAKVLIRDSSSKVTFARNGCTVASGNWEDPYTGREHTRASDVQIDHFVPLKNAYISGAYRWSSQRRCLYANYMGNNFHLLSVNGKENTTKSDRTPEGYMPPQRSYQCQYLVQWLKTKLIWSLGLTPPEKETVLNLVRENHCSISDFKYSEQELMGQRRFISENMDLCQ